MTELNGLANILANTNGTLHTIAEPPERFPSETDQAYAARFRAWHTTINYWHVSVERPHWHDDALPEEAP